MRGREKERGEIKGEGEGVQARSKRRARGEDREEGGRTRGINVCGGSKGVFWGERMLENKTARQREYVATRADERERERQRV